MSNMCLVVTPAIKGLADKIRQEYPEACERNGFNDQMCAEWVGLYNNTNDKSPDEVPSMKTLVSFIERLRSKEGKSFLQEIQSEEVLAAIQQEMDEIKAKAIADGTFMKAPNGKPTNLTERQWLQVRTKTFKRWFGDWEKVAKLVASFINNNNVLTIKENEYTDDFRRIQRESKSLLPEEISEYHRGRLQGISGDSFKRNLGRVYEGLLSRGTSSSLGSWSLRGKDNHFKIRRVNGSLFHDIFEINRNYLENGELVDLHDDYSTCKCYLSDDGLCGFAIEPDGNLISVFSLNPSNKKGFLYAIKDFIREEGATHLDAYASKNQNLEEIYAKTLGFHVASEMDYNMEYDHDNIAENHGRPKVVFMVNQQVTRKSFDKDSYDDAAGYAESSVKALDADVSKVVDENGEPLVVYHHTDNPDLTKFSTEHNNYFAKDGGTKEAIFFDEEKTGTLNRKYDLPVFLNIRELNEYNETKQQLHDRGTTYREVVNNSAKNNNRTGGVHMNNFDDNGKENQSIWIIHNPNQVKSATDNIGTFSPENEDILYHRNPTIATRAQNLAKLKYYYEDVVSDLVKRRKELAERKRKEYSKRLINRELADSRGKVQKEDIKNWQIAFQNKYGSIANSYLFTLPNGDVKLVVKPLSEEELMNKALAVLDELSDEAIVLELQRIEQENGIDGDYMYYINPKKLEEVKAQVAKKNSFFSKEEIEENIMYLADNFKNTPEENLFVQTAIKWLKNGTVTFPRDSEKVLQVFKAARKLNIDVQGSKSPIDLELKIVKAQTGKDSQGSPINPKNYPELSYDRTVVTSDGKQIVIYNVENTEAGQMAVVDILATASPKIGGEPAPSPWCLSTFNYSKVTRKASPTQSARNFWDHYNNGRRQIAFVDGMPVAFNSSSEHKLESWWDFNDRVAYSNIEEIDLEAPQKMYENAAGNPQYMTVTSGIYEYGYIGEKIDSIRIPQIRTVTYNDSYPYTFINFTPESPRNLGGVSISATPDGNNKILVEPALISGKGFSVRRTFDGKISASIGWIKGTDLKDDKYIKEKVEESCKNAFAYEENIVKLFEEAFGNSFDIQNLQDVTKLKELREKAISEVEKNNNKYWKIANEAYLKALEEVRQRQNEQRNKQQKEFKWELYEEIDDNGEIKRTLVEEPFEHPFGPDFESVIEEDILSDSWAPLNIHRERGNVINYSGYETEDDADYVINNGEEELDKINKMSGQKFSMRELLQALNLGKEKSYADAYNERVRKPLNKELAAKLHSLLKEWNFEVVEESLKEVFGDDVLGALDVLQKIVYLAEEGDRNQITDAEEFSHAFIKLMGATYRKQQTRERHPENKKYSELRDLITETDLYKQTYDQYSEDPQYKYNNGNVNAAKIAEEAMGKALAVALNERYEALSAKDKSFIEKIKQWFKDALLWFKSHLNKNGRLERELNNMADSILKGDYEGKYLPKAPENAQLVTFEGTVERDAEEGGHGLNIIRQINQVGGVLTGSMSYRAQGEVYRTEQDTLHDLDFIFEMSPMFAQHPSLKNTFVVKRFDNADIVNLVQEDYRMQQILELPNMHFLQAFPSTHYNGETQIIATLMYSENPELAERFRNLSGTYANRLEQFTEEERSQIYLIDCFFLQEGINTEYYTPEDTDLTVSLANYREAFRSKLKFGRAKDLIDYRQWKPARRNIKGNAAQQDLLMQRVPGNNNAPDLTIYEDIPVELVESMIQEQDEREAMDQRESSDPDLHKKFGYHDEVTVSEILGNLLESGTPFEGFIKSLQKNLGDLGNIKIKLVPNSHASVYGIAGLYSTLENTIYINRNSDYKGKGGKVDATILHEIVHAIVANSLQTAKHREELGRIFDDVREKLFKKYNVSSFEELPEYLRKGRLYGLQSLDEFAAEFFTNGEFVLELNDRETFGDKSDKGSIISRLVEWIKSLLPKGVTDTYKQAGSILEDILLNSGGTIQDYRDLLGSDENAASTQRQSFSKLSTPKSPLQVYSDGSDFKGTGKIGYGAVFEYSGKQYGISGTEANKEVKKLQKQFPEAKFSNPTMEMLALATVLEHFANMGNGENITINQDYKGAVNYEGLWEYSEGSNQRDGKAWKAREPYIAHLVDRAKTAIEKIEKDGGSVKINWVKGHQKAGTEEARMNDAADSYAKSRDNSNTINDAYGTKKPVKKSTSKKNTFPITKQKGYWTRDEAEKNPDVLYVFTDNTDRDSGFGKIPDDSWYAKKYGTGHHYPKSTTAVLRGLDNARPISTQRWYHKGAKGNSGRWVDADVNEFRKVIREELQDLVDAFNSGDYTEIRFPDGDGLFNADISNISIARTPELCRALADLLTEFGFESLIPKDVQQFLGRSTSASRNKASSSDTASSIDPRFKQGIETIASYYKKGSNGFPGIPNRIHNKLNDHFTKGTELTDDDYREMSEYINIVSQTDPKYGTVLKAEPIKGLPESSGKKSQATGQKKQSHIAKTIQDRVTFTESSSSDYPQRTRENAKWSDVTIDFTESDKGSGGNKEFTKEAAGDKYVHFKLHNEGETAYDAQEILEAIRKAGLPTKNIKLNIAGSEIAKLKGSQAVYNNEITRLIKGLLDLGVTIQEIRSGGQTGIDEAGIIAAKRLGITASVHAPKGWRFRDKDKKEHYSKEEFMERFLEKKSSADVQGDTNYSYRERTPAPEGAVYNPSRASGSKKMERPKSDSYENALKTTVSEIGNFYNTFTPQQIKDRGTMLADYFSDIIDDYLSDEFDRLNDEISDPDTSEEQKEQDRALLNLLKDPVNGRQFAANKLQIGNIVAEIKRRVKRNAETHTGKQKKLWQNTLEYFDELFENQASIEIEEQEGIRIIGLKTADVSLDESINDARNDGDDDTGHIVSGNDGWLFQTRFEDPSNSLSKSVKRMLYNIERGKDDVDDLGHQRKYSSGQIYATLLSYLAKNMQNPDDFMYLIRPEEYTDDSIPGFNMSDLATQYPYGYPVFPVLEKMREQYPWADQIINRLTNDWLSEDWNPDTAYPSTFGAMSSQFYSNFRKAFIPYAKIQVGNGKFGVTPLNIEMAERCQKDKLIANYNNGITLTDLSIYNQDTTVNKVNAKKLAKMTADMLRDNIPSELHSLHQDIISGTEVDKEDSAEYERMIKDIVYVMESFGITANKEGVIALLNAEDKGLAIKGILKDLNNIAVSIGKIAAKDVASFDYLQDLKYPSGEPMWKNFFKDRGIISDESYMQSFYDSASKKTRYSYSSDNYLQKTFRGLYNKDLAARRRFMDERFKKYEWFYNHKTRRWRNKWLEILYNAKDLTDVLPYRNINNITETHENIFGEKSSTIRDYSEWSPTDIWLVQNRSYDGSSPYTYYLTPIFSDSPMSMTVRGPVLSEEDVLDALVSTVDQELWRIKYVSEDRAKAIKEGKVEPIANFDIGKKGKSRGMEFCFIPELNDYIIPSTGEKFLDALMRMKRNETIDGKRKVYSASAIKKIKEDAIRDIMEQKALEYAKENSGMYPRNKDKELELPADFLQTYMNMVYANISIIQVTTVDLAYYKSNVDFQKRFKEVYAGGIELNTNSRYGLKYENSIILKDDEITSPSYETIAGVIDASDNLSRADKERIKKVFRNINIADAQAIRSMYSFRSIMDMMGRWDTRMENAMQHFHDKNWQKEDFDIIYQTIKPFMYTVTEKSDGIGGMIPVPHQHKNSEICALMMYDLIVNDLKSPVYSALSEFMDETMGADGKPLIHMAEFESAVKVGNQGVIDIRFSADRLMRAISKDWDADDDKDKGIRGIIDKIKWKKLSANNVDNAGKNYEAIKEQLDDMLDKHISKSGKEENRISQADYRKIMAYLRPTKEEIKSILKQKAIIVTSNGTNTINPERVHTTSMENYYQAQPTPAHHIDAEAVFGSQARNIAPADLPDDFVMTLTGKRGKTLTLKGKDAIVDFYYELLNENLIEDFYYKKDGDKDLSLKGIFESKEAFRKAVENIVRGNPKYGSDFIEALRTDSDGNYVLSPNSPTMFTLMQEIVTSLFKNHITKQKINGAALIQAAGIGLDEELRLVEGKNGKVIGAECLIPLTSKDFFEPFIEERIINGEKVKVLDPNKLRKAGLEKAIGYRIPTENTSSMLPLIIKGFTPLQNGSTIILPAEITALAGSDFDVDKMFIMLSEFYVETHDIDKAWKAFDKIVASESEYAERRAEAFNKAMQEGIIVTDALDEEFRSDYKEWRRKEFRKWFEANKEDFPLDKPEVKRVEYDFDLSPEANGRRARNNLVIQMIFSMITEGKNDSLLNPQGFENFKGAAKLNRILEDPVLKGKLLENYAAASNETIPSASQIRKTFLEHYKHWPEKERKKLERTINRYPDEIIIGMYLETMKINNPESKKDDIISILLKSSVEDREKFVEDNSSPESPIYPQTFAHSHERNMAGMNQIGIGAVQASMTAKYQRVKIQMKEDQQFKINNRDITEVDVSDGGKTLKNCGEIIGACADNGKDPNLSDAGSTTDTLPILDYMLRCGLTHEEAVLVLNSPIMLMGEFSSAKMRELGYHKAPVGNVTTRMLVKAKMNPFSISAMDQKHIEALCYRVICQAEAMDPLTKISRADSPNGAMQNSFAKARVQQYMVDFFNAKMGQASFPFNRIQGVLDNTSIDVEKGEKAVREALKKQPMALLHGFYALGINSINYLGKNQFFMLKKEFDDAVVKPLLYNQHQYTSQADLEELVDNIYLQYITFVLSSSPLFGDETNEDGTTVTMKEKRDYYLTSFARDFTTTMQKYPEIYNLLGSVLQRDGNRVVLKDVGSLGKRQKEIVSRRFDALFSLGKEGSELRKAGRDLAKDLLLFAYYDSGLNFSHDSYSTRLSTYFLTQFDEYVSVLRRLDNPIDDEYVRRFHEQFLVTNPKAAHYISDRVADNNMIDGKIVIDMDDFEARGGFVNMIMSPDPKYSGINPYSYIRTKGAVWVLDQESYRQDPSTAEYIRLEDYPTSTVRTLYNMNKSVAELSEEYRDKDNTPPSPAQKDPVGEDDYDIEHNSGYDNPILDNPEELFNPMPKDEGYMSIDYSSILNDPNIPNSQTPAGQFDDDAEMSTDILYNDQDFLENPPC